MKNIQTIYIVLLGVAFTGIFAIALYPAWSPKSYQITVGSPTTEDIVAPTAIRDQEATEQARQAAEKKVNDVYERVEWNASELANRLMGRIMNVNSSESMSVEKRVQFYEQNLFPLFIDSYYDKRIEWLKQEDPEKYKDYFVDDIKTQLTDFRYNEFPTELFDYLAKLEQTELTAMENVMIRLIPRIYAQPIKDVNSVRDNITDLVAVTDIPTRQQRQLVVELLRYVIAPDYFLNRISTEFARAEARQAVSDRWIEKGTVIVKQGEQITPELYQLLDKLDLIQNRNPFTVNLGLWMFAILLFLTAYVLLREQLPVDSPLSRHLMILTIYLLAVLLMLVISTFDDAVQFDLTYVTPLAFAGVLIALLHHARTAYVSAFILGILASALFNENSGSLFDFQIGFYLFALSTAAIYTADQLTKRAAIVKTGLLMGLIGSVVQLSFVLLLGQNRAAWWWLEPVIAACANGLLTIVLVLGMMPIFESVFKVLSNMKLMELGNHNHPLLQQLMKEAPGTYHHSLMVANLAGAAAEELGVNSLLCRTCAYYHDVGKLVRPSFFIENNRNVINPHDSLDPQVSRAMLISHVADGVQMLKNHKIPKVIVDIVSQHHGTTVIRYFYNRAVENTKVDPEAPPAHIDDFRYPGPKPQSMEALILLIADSVEAAVRSLRLAEKEEIAMMIDSIIKDKLDDRQFNDCAVTLKDLETIGKVMKQLLVGTHHERISYVTNKADKTMETES